MSENEVPAETVEEVVVKAPELRSEAGIELLRRHLTGEDVGPDTLAVVLDAFARPLGYRTVDLDEVMDDWDDGEGWLSCDPDDLSAARSCAQRGAIDDALHHLERALPEDFGEIAERIAAHLRTRS